MKVEPRADLDLSLRAEKKAGRNQPAGAIRQSFIRL
jgi:hypothetical protein